MTDQTQQDSLEDQVEFRLSKKAKCVCRFKVTNYASEICDQYAYKFGTNGCANPSPLNPRVHCGHFEACHAPFPTQEGNQ